MKNLLVYDCNEKTEFFVCINFVYGGYIFSNQLNSLSVQNGLKSLFGYTNTPIVPMTQPLFTNEIDVFLKFSPFSPIESL